MCVFALCQHFTELCEQKYRHNMDPSRELIMLITFTHAYRPYWLANAIELCTKQTRNRVCVTQPLAMYKTARFSLILPTKMLVRTRYVQFTYFMGRVYYSGGIRTQDHCDSRAVSYLKICMSKTKINIRYPRCFYFNS